jgi:hypothetical protein
VIRVQVRHLPRPTARAKKTLWLWWSGPAGAAPDLDICWRAYIHRFDIEHTIRYLKRSLARVTPRVRTPGQADRRAWLILPAFAQLNLARLIAADLPAPWEKPRPQDRLTPGRVRRAFRHIRADLPVLASPPQPWGRSPGCPKGRLSGAAQRYPAIKKAG